MSRLFRRANGGIDSYAALAVFAATYLAAMLLVLAPNLLLSPGGLP